MEYKIVYSKRRTVAITVSDGVPLVKAPIGIDKKTADELVEKHADWIRKHIEIERKRASLTDDLTERDIKELKKAGRVYFRDKTAYYAEIMGLKYGRITITSAEKRFGSCSSQRNISFSYRLMLYPEEAREYVIVHELAHLCEMNHSKKFYAIIEGVLPDYKARRRLLKYVD